MKFESYRTIRASSHRIKFNLSFSSILNKGKGMMNNMDLDVNAMNKVIKNTIGKISSSREQILNIVDNIRKDQESLKLQLGKVGDDITRVIDEVDEMKKQDKAERRKLVEVSSNFDKYTESDIKDAYERASDIRVKFYTKKSEEKSLRERRDSLEIALKKTMMNIEDGEKIINQISIAMGYLEGDILTALEGAGTTYTVKLPINREVIKDEKRGDQNINC